MAPPRTVRIARRDGSATTPGERTASAFVANTAGSARAGRLLLLFMAALGVIYLAFAGLTIANPLPGVRDNLYAWGAFTLVALLLALWGWSITLARAPVGARKARDGLVVRERGGSVRRFEARALDELHVVQRYPNGLLAPAPTALVELRTPEGGKRTYLVGDGFFEDIRSTPAP